MFVNIIADGSPPPSWIDIHSVPQDLIIGVVTTFIGLLILFSIKPRLEVEPKPCLPPNKGEKTTTDVSRDERSPTLGFTVTNKGLRKVLEVQVRLFRIDRTETFDRHKISLDIEELFEIRGRLSRAKPYMALAVRGQQPEGGSPSPRLATRWWLVTSYLARLRPSRRADSEKNIAEYWRRYEKDKRSKQKFTFWVNKEIVSHMGELKEADVHSLRESDYILFQVIAKDGFTGFTSLKTRRFYKRELENNIAEATADTPSASNPLP
jgi:hypothetical protein